MAMPWPPPTHIDSSPNGLAGVLEGIEQGGHDAGPGLAERVAEGDGTAAVTFSLS